MGARGAWFAGEEILPPWLEEAEAGGGEVRQGPCALAGVLLTFP